MDTAIARGQDKALKIPVELLAGWMDTKANLLNKSGKIKEAIELEEKAIALNESTWRRAALDVMKRGEPTWGALYDLISNGK